MTVQVSVSLLSANPTCLGADLARIHKSGSDFVHIDVMDGHYVPNMTFGPDIITALKKDSSLPFDVHLMVEDADRFIDMYAPCSDMITIHPETTKHLHRSLEFIRSKGKKVGVSLNPGTSVALIEPIFHMLDLVLIMSVNPGFGGQKFILESAEKIKAIKDLSRLKNHAVEISVDGGINDVTAGPVVKAGATILVSGSYLFKQEEMKEGVQRLKKSGSL